MSEVEPTSGDDASVAPSAGRWPRWAGLAFLALLVVFSLHLGAHRIIQVDEALNVTMARLIATHKAGQFFTAAPLMLLGPLAWIAGRFQRSADIFLAFRLFFVVLMWVNVWLTARATRMPLRGSGGLLVIILAATLAPMWDYGFEIRHDIPLVTGVLLLWGLVRPGAGTDGRRHIAAGALAGLLQFLAFKAFLYTLPLLALSLVLGTGGWKRPSLRGLGGLVLGVLLGLGMGRLLHGLAGTWDIYWNDFLDARHNAAEEVTRFSPWESLRRVLRQAPLLSAGSLAALSLPFVLGRKARTGGLAAEPWFPEWVFLVLCLGLFLLNPTPFPYNLIHLVPAMFIAVVRCGAPLLDSLAAVDPSGRWLLACTALLSQGIPWANATSRHLKMTNERQVQLMDLAEQLTDPARHRVLDGSGLVPTRDPAGRQWIIHSFTIRRLSDGTWPPIRQLIAENEIPVILTSYRTEGLPEADLRVVREHYVPLAEDCMVLGAVGQGGALGWTALAEGRYALLPDAKARQSAILVDGREAPSGPLQLGRGSHRFTFAPDGRLLVLWMGPKGSGPPRLPPADHPLFVNWY